MAGDRGPWVVAVTWVSVILATIATVLRFHVRHTLRIKIGWDDWTMLIAVAIRLASQIRISVSLQYGLGKHDKDLSPYQLVQILKYNWLALPLGLVVSTVARISIAILLVQLFGTTNKSFKWFTIILTVLLSGLSIALIPITFLQISPSEALWNVYMTSPVKVNINPKVWLYMAYLIQSLCTFTDLAFVLIPVTIIWSLKMPTRRKIGLIALMSVSLFTMAMSICKIMWIAAAANATSASTDTQYTATFQVLFGVLEQDFVIIMGCVPPLAKLELPKSIGSFGQSVSSLIKKTIHRSSAPSSGSHEYHNMMDLELSTTKLGVPPTGQGLSSDVIVDPTVHAPVFHHKDTSLDSLADHNNIRRTDQFTISWNQPKMNTVEHGS